MKKTVFSVAVLAALLFGTRDAHAQAPYKYGIGLVLDGNGDSHTVGIQYKTPWGPTATQMQLFFRSNWLTFGGDYLYQKALPDAEGLSWYVGAGPQLTFWWVSGGTSSSAIGLRPLGGLEYKIRTLPLALHLDYKPYIAITGGGGFDGGGFTVGVKYTLN